ncbi:unnamed protein product [Scytosiphon promiscuus]
MLYFEYNFLDVRICFKSAVDSSYDRLMGIRFVNEVFFQGWCLKWLVKRKNVSFLVFLLRKHVPLVHRKLPMLGEPRQILNKFGMELAHFFAACHHVRASGVVVVYLLGRTSTFDVPS